MNISIRTKLLFASGLAALLAVIVGIAGYWGVTKTDASMSKVNNIAWVLQNKGKIEGVHSHMRADALRAIVDVTEGRRSSSPVTYDHVSGHVEKLNALFDGTDVSGLEPATQSAFSEYRAASESYMSVSTNMLNRARQGGVASSVLLRDLNQAFDKLNAKAANFVERINAEITLSQKIGSDSALWSKNIIVWIIIISCIVFGVISIVVAKSITSSLYYAIDVADNIAKGDLTSRIESANRDETGHLIRTLRKMNESLAKVVGDVRLGAGSIAEASREIAIGNADLSERTESQASSLEETATAMEQMTATVKQNADNARQASQLANAAQEQASAGALAVTHTIGAMDEIEKSSRKIADIISVIDEIAFQTNLLALNAAVEAARAGEQGRGFAVVATEVRNLAQRSATAAREIKDLINESVSKVQVGSELVENSGETLAEIVQAVKKVTDIVAEISAASQEQSTGISEVNRSVINMDEMTQKNSALVQSAASASKSMQEQASALSVLVSVFRLSEHDIQAQDTDADLDMADGAGAQAQVYALRDSGRTQAPAEPTPSSARAKTGTVDGEWEEF